MDIPFLAAKNERSFNLVHHGHDHTLWITASSTHDYFFTRILVN